jgi:hypothetical protein
MDWATAVAGKVRIMQVGGAAWSAQRIPTVINHGFLDWCCHFFK